MSSKIQLLTKFHKKSVDEVRTTFVSIVVMVILCHKNDISGVHR